jgi:hypothetical protein
MIETQTRAASVTRKTMSAEQHNLHRLRQYLLLAAESLQNAQTYASALDDETMRCHLSALAAMLAADASRVDKQLTDFYK